MKRLSVLAVTALTAFVLSACGENVGKKVEETAASMEGGEGAKATMPAAPNAAATAPDAGAKTGAATAQPAAPKDSADASAEAASAEAAPQAAQ